MPRSSSPSSDDKTDYSLELHNFLAALSQNAEREPVASEIEGKRSLSWFLWIVLITIIPRSSAVYLWRRRDSPLASIGIKWEEIA